MRTVAIAICENAGSRHSSITVKDLLAKPESPTPSSAGRFLRTLVNLHHPRTKSPKPEETPYIVSDDDDDDDDESVDDESTLQCMPIVIPDQEDSEEQKRLKYVENHLVGLPVKKHNDLCECSRNVKPTSASKKRSRRSGGESIKSESDNDVDSCCHNSQPEAPATAFCCLCSDAFKVGEIASRSSHCEHLFHTACIKEWLLDNHDCPCCGEEYFSSAADSKKKKKKDDDDADPSAFAFCCLEHGPVNPRMIRLSSSQGRDRFLVEEERIFRPTSPAATSTHKKRPASPDSHTHHHHYSSHIIFEAAFEDHHHGGGGKWSHAMYALTGGRYGKSPFETNDAPIPATISFPRYSGSFVE